MRVRVSLSAGVAAALLACGGNVVVDGEGAGGVHHHSTVSGSNGSGGAPPFTTGTQPATISAGVGGGITFASAESSTMSASSSVTSSSSGGCGGLTDCNGSCVDTTTDPSHCSGCDVVCPPGDVCVASVCTMPTCCAADDQNSVPPYPTNTVSSSWVAWEYVPSCVMTIGRLELHAKKAEVALLDSADGKPGSVLAEGILDTPVGGWSGIDISPPLPLVAGHTYFIAQSPGTNSVASGGVQQTFYNAGAVQGPWEGPSTGLSFAARIRGACP